MGVCIGHVGNELSGLRWAPTAGAVFLICQHVCSADSCPPKYVKLLVQHELFFVSVISILISMYGSSAISISISRSLSRHLNIVICISLYLYLYIYLHPHPRLHLHLYLYLYLSGISPKTRSTIPVLHSSDQNTSCRMAMWHRPGARRRSH